MENTKRFIGMFSFGSGIMEFQEQKEKLVLFLEDDLHKEVRALLVKKEVINSWFGLSKSIVLDCNVSNEKIPSFLKEIGIPVQNFTEYFGTGEYQGETIPDMEMQEVCHV